MKKVLSLLAIVAIVMVSNCTRVPENNDPVIGIWYTIDVKSINETSKETIRQEWIFNDAYLGRYHRYSGSQLAFKTDFGWKENDGLYTISYPGTDMAVQKAILIDSPEGMQLNDEDGNILAIKE
ncbi:hypothetical protein [Eudoraea sp.]|uniref:hypothetical protein n=1 Tax=Eudoraea sp. TaxID=1979955 RepID=UPI003C74B3CE